MSQNRPASPATQTWKAELRDLLHDCAASAPAEQGDRIRDVWELLCHGAPVQPQLPAPLPDQQKLEAMLAIGAFESAAFSVIGDDTALMLSRGANGNYLASVVLPDGSEDVVAEGCTLALALLVAFLTSLLADSDSFTDASGMFQAGATARLN